jgi:hypothetical protein
MMKKTGLFSGVADGRLNTRKMYIIFGRTNFADLIFKNKTGPM